MKEEKYLVRDAKGNIFNELINPAVVFDKDLGVLLKIGEFDVMLEYYKETVNLYNNAKIGHAAESIALMNLPKNQDEIDKAFQISGYINVLYGKTKDN